MFLWVTGNTKVEWLAWIFDGGTINEESFVEQVDLFYQLCGMTVSVRCRCETLVFVSLVASQDKKILYT